MQGEPIVIGDQVDRNSKVTEPEIGNVKIFDQKAFSILNSGQLNLNQTSDIMNILNLPLRPILWR